MTGAEWVSIIQTAISSFAGGLAPSLLALVLSGFFLNSGCQLESKLKHEDTDQWLIESTGEKPAYVYKSDPKVKLKPVYLAKGQSIELVSAFGGGRVYYKRHRWVLTRKYITYGEEPDFYRKSLHRKMREGEFTFALLDRVIKKYPKIYMSDRIRRFLSLATTPYFRLTVTPSKSSYVFGLYEAFIDQEDGGAAVSLQFDNIPFSYLIGIRRSILRNKPSQNGKTLSWEVSKSEVKSIKKYLTTIKGHRAYKRSFEMNSPKEFYETLKHSPKFEDIRDQLFSPKSVPKDVIRFNKRVSLGKKILANNANGIWFEISNPKYIEDSVGLLFRGHIGLHDSVNKLREPRDHILFTHQGLVIVYDGYRNPKSFRINESDLNRVKNKAKHWKEW